jgi:hypothetical protein
MLFSIPGRLANSQNKRCLVQFQHAVLTSRLRLTSIVKHSLPERSSPFQRSVLSPLDFFSKLYKISHTYIRDKIWSFAVRVRHSLWLVLASATPYGWCLHPPLRLAGGNIRHSVWRVATSATPFGGWQHPPLLLAGGNIRHSFWRITDKGGSLHKFWLNG